MTKEQLQNQLNLLNEAVDDATALRDAFIKDNMHYFAEFSIGRKVINRDTGDIGIVTEHYQHPYDYHEKFNIHCKIEYISQHGVRREDNTSRYHSRHPWT